MPRPPTAPGADDTTASDASRSSELRLAEADALVFVIAWCPHEPDRVGELCIVPAAGSVVLGRGDADREPRMRFFRPRPGRLEPVPPLLSPGLSRRQLEIAGGTTSASVTRVGRCAMRINGRECDDGIVAHGDTISLRQELLLLCLRRPPCPAPLAYWEADRSGKFGEADGAGIVGESPAAWRVREQIAFAAKSEQHVLVLGETGTGKELAARAVHRLSSRAARPLVARNAATLPAGLIDAEVFGNARNYPNPGMADRPGLVGQADGGVLFLDEIGELPPELQSHLLRVLDSGGEYHRLGEPTVRRSDFRLLAATNRGAAELRHDLMARLVVTVSLPALAERREDVPLLLRHLAVRAANKSPELAGRFLERRGDARCVRIDVKLVDALVRRGRYRTNTRELDALLWKAMASSRGDVIVGSEDLIAEPLAAAERKESDHAVTPRAPNREPSAQEIRDTLRRESGNVARAAKLLGLSSRYALYRMLAKLGIDAKQLD